MQIFRASSCALLLSAHYFNLSTSFAISGRRSFSAIRATNGVLKMSDEIEAARIAASTDPAINPAAPTFFDKLIKKEIPTNILYEDDLCMAFSDINPQGPVHFLVIPKNKDGLNRLSNAREDQKAILVRIRRDYIIIMSYSS
jgi:HIT domain